MRSFPATRLRRWRRTPQHRSLVRESCWTPQELIQPIFIAENSHSFSQEDELPGFRVWKLEELGFILDELLEWKVAGVALFPVLSQEKKDSKGSYALQETGLIPKALEHIKKGWPNLLLMADVALDPYTSHGHDGLWDENLGVLNDETVDLLVKQGRILARSGADILAPSDMMDGRIRALREDLELQGFKDTILLSYTAKYASSLYSPFRQVLGSGKNLQKKDKKSYQMDPAQGHEAEQEAFLDLQEGADALLVKPGLAYLDIIYRLSLLKVPVFAYEVSGEYAMARAASRQGYLDYDSWLEERLTSFRRAGAKGILTYDALQAARLWKERS